MTPAALPGAHKCSQQIFCLIHGAWPQSESFPRSTLRCTCGRSSWQLNTPDFSLQSWIACKKKGRPPSVLHLQRGQGCWIIFLVALNKLTPRKGTGTIWGSRGRSPVLRLSYERCKAENPFQRWDILYMGLVPTHTRIPSMLQTSYAGNWT